MKRFSIPRVATALLALVVAAPPVSAQTTTGSIRALVTDAEGASVPGVSCTAETVASNVKRTGLTGANGEALLSALPPSDKYVVACALSGFNGSRSENILVTSGNTTTLRIGLQLASISEELTITAETPLVDMTRATTGQDLTLEFTENLPTARSYQGYLQLVPGVSPDLGGASGASGNPAARSGMNFADIDGVIGTSTDNYYYIEGINVTDPETGTFGANLNTEVIQEQKVLTGGIPSEFVGSSGLVSSVITKSGGADFFGSVGYGTADDGLRADNKHSPDANFSREDASITLGGPLFWKDTLWFFGSYREIDISDDITTLDTGVFIRTVDRKDEQAFGKISAAISQNQQLTASWMEDPTEISGSTSRTVVGNRDLAQIQGGERYLAAYTGIFGPVVVELASGKHNGEVSTVAAVRDELNGVIFLRTAGSTLAQQQLGGAGSDTLGDRDNEFSKGSLEWNLNTGSAGDHSIKFGVDLEKQTHLRNLVFTGDQFRGSLDNSLAGLTASQVSTLATTGQLTSSFFNVNNTSDLAGLITTINSLPNAASFYAAYDLNHDGTITAAELGSSLIFSSTAGNPNGKINYDRNIQSQFGPQNFQTEGTSFYLQDNMRWNNWSFNVGARAEEWVQNSAAGVELFTFDWDIAPRVSAVWDIQGDGKQKLAIFGGRYYDPIRTNITRFAGSDIGSVTLEQVFINNEWVTYRTRGGAAVIDGFIGPETKTPYTDEYLASYSRDLGGSQSVELSVYHRETRDIIDDYDPFLYLYTKASGRGVYPGDENSADTLFLGNEYFNFPAGVNPNFIITTIKGGKRDLDGAELVYRKRLSNSWQGIASYTYSDATGNINSSSNADFVGDALELDPRAPNTNGKLPGSIDHLVKASASYHFDFGLVMGASFRWNSGSYSTRSYVAVRRFLPVVVAPGDAFASNGVPSFQWVQSGAVGGIENPDYYTFDVSAHYTHAFGPVEGELFLSVANILDDQAAVRTQELVAGQGTVLFGQDKAWVDPRTITLGVRLGFGR